MSWVFKHNSNAKYSTKDLKRGHNSSNVSLLDANLNEKGPNAKIQLLNIFRDHHLVAKLIPIAAGYLLQMPIFQCPLDDGFFYKYKLESNEYFYVYNCQIKLRIIFVTSALSIFI